MASSSVNKRLKNELGNLMCDQVPGISAFPEDDNLFCWAATLTGPNDTPYEGFNYKLKMVFPQDYPFRPPTITFETPIFHPNVSEKGEICLDILKESWSAVYNVQTILISLQSLLGEPNNNSPLNPKAAHLWEDQQNFKLAVREKTPGFQI